MKWIIVEIACDFLLILLILQCKNNRFFFIFSDDNNSFCLTNKIKKVMQNKE